MEFYNRFKGLERTLVGDVKSDGCFLVVGFRRFLGMVFVIVFERLNRFFYNVLFCKEVNVRDFLGFFVGYFSFFFGM